MAIRPEVQITPYGVTFNTMLSKTPQRLTFSRAYVTHAVGRELGDAATKTLFTVASAAIGNQLSESIKANREFAVIDLKTIFEKYM